MLHIITIFGTFFLGIILTSCGNINIELADEEHIQNSQAFDYIAPKYEIGPSDILGLTLYYSPVKSKTLYLIQIGDVLKVEFSHYPEYNRSLLVRPDGYITLPLAGEIMAAGLSPSQLCSEIHERQKNNLVHPNATVTMERINTVIERFKETMKSDNFGETTLINVRPDGYAIIPLIGEIHFAGKTVSLAEQEIKDKYNNLLGDIEVSLNVRSAKSNLFYVMGWVHKPGFYQITGPTTVTQGIAMAGGFRDEAQRSNIVLVTRDEEKHPVGKLIDADDIIGIANIANDSFLNQYDIIYVPPTTLAKGSIIGRELWSMIPFRFTMSYQLNDN